ncbi:MAG: pyruvate ferredoxin oxidoreductase subunit gamma [Deltaproteobacteria bacterium]|nr:pyruvate ferredoxin oxidoreductase subunit gamma [Deltaproteobacteria bacterium]MBW2075007.1 pyruvate ferredoxin oxidoreductase subunit gamma [Deltaproteobacteria bacterium]
MIEIRVHGRGGQGAVTSTELMALAAINEGKYAQAFPSFGPERRGAPVMAFVRIGDAPIRTRERVYTPDIVVVLDPTILKIVDVTAGLKKNGMVILNTSKDEGEVRKAFGIKAKMALVDATGIAIKHLGRPITNTTMLGALIKATGVIDIKSMETPLKERFGRIAEKNLNAMNEAYHQVQ